MHGFLKKLFGIKDKPADQNAEQNVNPTPPAPDANVAPEGLSTGEVSTPESTGQISNI